MAKLLSTGIYGFICSAKKVAGDYIEHFLTGFAGYGWKIWEYTTGKWMFEIDSLRVRGSMVVYELIISKIRSLIGALAISQGQGKIKTVTLSEDKSEYLITVEGEMSFVENDFIKCQTFTGNQKMYHVKISSIENENIIHIPVLEFTEYLSIPEVGDEIVQFGNKSKTSRQSAIYIHADEQDQPAIDVMFGINSKDWSNCVKIRIGGNIPGTDGLKGLYVENGMLKGTDSTGATVYCIHPNGTAEFGNGSAQFKNDKSGYLAGGAISWKWDVTKNKFITTFGNVLLSWDNLDEETKENLKGRPGKDANLLEWVDDWNNNKTLIGGEYIISPKMFSGTRDADGKLTGVAFGHDCIKINGVWRTGIFSVVKDKIIFALDPITQEYKFTGTVEVTDTDGNVTTKIDGSTGELTSKRALLEKAEIQGKVTTSSAGRRIVLDPSDNTLKMYNSEGKVIATLQFVEYRLDGMTSYIPKLTLSYYVGNTLMQETQYGSGGFDMFSYFNGHSYRCVFDPINGITFLKDGAETKRYLSS